MSEFERYSKENYIVPMTVEQKGGHLHAVILGEMAADHIVGKRVLHVGCNAGTTTYHLQPLEPDYLAGVDVNVEAIQEAKKLIPTGHFHHAVAHDIPFEDSSFDTIVLFAVLEHMFKRDKSLAVKEFERVLAHNGVVLVQVPKATPGSKDQKLRQNAYDPHHESLYHTEQELHADFPDWECLKSYYEDRPNPNNGARHSAWIAIYKNPKPKPEIVEEPEPESGPEPEPPRVTTKSSDIDLRELRSRTVKMKLDPKPKPKPKKQPEPTMVEEEDTAKLAINQEKKEAEENVRESKSNPSAQIRSNWGYDNPHDY